LNGGTLGGVLVVIVAVFLMAMGEYAGVSRGLAPEKLGEITGRRLGEAFIAVCIAILVSLIYQRHRRKTRRGLVPEGRDDESAGATGGR